MTKSETEFPYLWSNSFGRTADAQISVARTCAVIEPKLYLETRKIVAVSVTSPVLEIAGVPDLRWIYFSDNLN